MLSGTGMAESIERKVDGMERDVAERREHATEVTQTQLQADAGRYYTLNVHTSLAEIRTNGEVPKKKKPLQRPFCFLRASDVKGE